MILKGLKSPHWLVRFLYSNDVTQCFNYWTLSEVEYGHVTIIPSHILQPLPLVQHRRLSAPPQSSKAAHHHYHQPSVASPSSHVLTRRLNGERMRPLVPWLGRQRSTARANVLSHQLTLPRSPCRHVSSTGFTITEEDRRRIYIFGAGNKGIFVAHCLRSTLNPPPVTFLVNNARRIEQFNQAGRK
jgi:hypothetical protein